ncbi:MAG: cation acetate symporter [Vulcanimicrobiaceae bacterium]
MFRTTVVMFAVFVGITLVVTYVAAGKSTTSRGFYTANRTIAGWQNGWAIAGDYISAATFLGITGLIAFYGLDGFLFAVGWLVSYLLVLFLIAEPLRNAGKYTLVDVISFRLRGRNVRAIAAVSTLAITLFYMIAQMVGAGTIVEFLLPQIGYTTAIVVVGVLMLVYVLFGGMLATTWVQIIKAGLLMITVFAMTVLVLAHFGFSFNALLGAATHVQTGEVTNTAPLNLLQPGSYFTGPAAKWDMMSLALALILGTAGLPHILMRFFTVPNAKAARTSVAWAMVLIGVFYLTTAVIGLGAALLVGQDNIGKHVSEVYAIRYINQHPEQARELNAKLRRDGFIVPEKNTNMAAPLLAQRLGGPLLTAFVSAVAFATILAVVAGLTIAASSAFAHDIWQNVVRDGKGDEREHIFVARTTALVFGALSIFLAIGLRNANVAFLVGLAFAVAASANVPPLLFALSWKRFSRGGAMTGMILGLGSSLILIAVGPAVMGVDAPGTPFPHLIEHAPLFPLSNPGLVSIPLGFVGAIIGTLAARDPESESAFAQLRVRANTGLGAEI